jgi:hypothetical protein
MRNRALKQWRNCGVVASTMQDFHAQSQPVMNSKLESFLSEKLAATSPPLLRPVLWTLDERDPYRLVAMPVGHPQRRAALSSWIAEWAAGQRSIDEVVAQMAELDPVLGVWVSCELCAAVTDRFAAHRDELDRAVNLVRAVFSAQGVLVADLVIAEARLRELSTIAEQACPTHDERFYAAEAVLALSRAALDVSRRRSEPTWVYACVGDAVQAFAITAEVYEEDDHRSTTLFARMMRALSNVPPG